MVSISTWERKKKRRHCIKLTLQFLPKLTFNESKYRPYYFDFLRNKHKNPSLTNILAYTKSSYFGLYLERSIQLFYVFSPSFLIPGGQGCWRERGKREGQLRDSILQDTAVDIKECQPLPMRLWTLTDRHSPQQTVRYRYCQGKCAL